MNTPHNWIQEAQRRLDDARLLLAHERPGRAVSAAYYAVHAAGKGALLTTEVTELRSHAGLIRLASYHFVRPGQLPDDTASLIRDVHEKRLGADCDLEPYGEAEAHAQLDDAETLIERFAALV